MFNGVYCCLRDFFWCVVYIVMICGFGFMKRLYFFKDYWWLNGWRLSGLWRCFKIKMKVIDVYMICIWLIKKIKMYWCINYILIIYNLWK